MRKILKKKVERGKKMLIHKRIGELGKFVSTDPFRKYLHFIAVIGEEAMATDGFMLTIMPIKKNDDDYPSKAGEELEGTLPEVVLLDPKRLDQAIKNLPKKPVLPVLENVQIGKGKSGIVISSGMPPVQFPSKEKEDDGLERDYPNVKKVIPNNEKHHPLKFAFDARLMKQICELAIKHGNRLNRKIIMEIPTTELKIVLDDNKNPVRDENGDLQMKEGNISKLTSGLKFAIPGGYEGAEIAFYGVLMPIRIWDPGIE